MYILYFFVAITSTTIGAITGVGGGVIIKPMLDILGHFDSLTISTLSAFTVLSMAIVSMTRQIISHAKIDMTIVPPLALGSILGGVVGQKMLSYILTSVTDKSHATVVQNALLAVIILIILLYTINKKNIKSYSIRGMWKSAGIGMSLGIISSFLAIGGGPINVVAFIYFFSYDIKKATQSSIITILFAQIANLFSIWSIYGFKEQDLSILPVMIIAAISGGLIGSRLGEKLSNKSVTIAFSILQTVVFMICIINIILNLR